MAGQTKREWRCSSSAISGSLPTTSVAVTASSLVRRPVVIDLEDDMDVVGTAGSVTEAIKVFNELKPDVVVADLQLQDGTGLDIVRTIRKTSNETGLIVLTMHSGDDQIFAAMQAGASAFVGKDSRAAEVLSAAKHAAVAPRTFLCSGLSAGSVKQ